ncbi:MAG: T9SS type A sorting domain-containing protein [Salibacteraceae bacterium]
MDKNGCSIKSRSFSINQPKEIISDFSIKTEVDVNEDLDLENYSVNAQEFYWLINRDTFSTKAVPAYSIDTEGTFEIELFAKNGVCSDSLTRKVTVKSLTSSLFELNEKDLNVVHSNNEILLINSTNKNINVKVYTINGQAMNIENTVLGESELRLDISTLPSGVYIVNYQSKDQTINGSKKLVIH